MAYSNAAATAKKPKANPLHVAKRASLQFMTTVSGILGHSVDRFDAKFGEEIAPPLIRIATARVSNLLGTWNQPFPTTLKLLGLARELDEAANEIAYSPLERQVLRAMHEMLRTVALTASAEQATYKLDELHLGVLLGRSRVLVGDDRWFLPMRQARDRVFKDLLAQLR
jgi:hypothetical protein